MEQVIKLVVNDYIRLGHVLRLVPKVSIASSFPPQSFLGGAPLCFIVFTQFLLILIVIFRFFFMTGLSLGRLISLKFCHSNAILNISERHMVSILGVFIEVLHEAPLKLFLYESLLDQILNLLLNLFLCLALLLVLLAARLVHSLDHDARVSYRHWIY